MQYVVDNFGEITAKKSLRRIFLNHKYSVKAVLCA